MMVEADGIMGYWAMRLGSFFPLLWRNVLPSLLVLWVHEITHNLEDKGSTFYATLERNYLNTGRNNPKDLVLNTSTGLQLQYLGSSVSFLEVSAPKVPHD